ncbi:hypothetical protein [Segatella copri]|jgi:hypothetical protein|uniref:hypothetical protein n=1 Tax=Segatella copri TaxID=165179 RepID=UPI00294AC952|nr:hypothetical protein [Segatella copri]
MEQNKEKLGVAIITAVYEVNGRKCCDEVKMGIACAKDFDRKERKKFTDVLTKWYKERVADIAIRKEKNNAKLIKITVRYKMQTCDFILNDKFLYGIIEGKICKK